MRLAAPQPPDRFAPPTTLAPPPPNLGHSPETDALPDDDESGPHPALIWAGLGAGALLVMVAVAALTVWLAG